MADGTMGSGVLDLVSRSGLLSRFVLLILFLFSVTSWAIVLRKVLHFRLVKSESERFRDVFRRSRKFSEVQAVCGSLSRSPLVAIFQTGYAELNAQLHSSSDGEADSENSDSRLTLRSIDALDRALQRAAAVEVNKIEDRVSFLATTASITPFIGLFGTVWGIMNSFKSIAVAQNTNLSVVAPGIAEALFATALGLFVAIPAVVAYNKISSDLSKYFISLEIFMDEFTTIFFRQLENR